MKKQWEIEIVGKEELVTTMIMAGIRICGGHVELLHDPYTNAKNGQVKVLIRRLKKD